MEFNSYIKTRRKLIGLTQVELANLSHVGVATIQNIEAGKANLEVKTLEKILTVLGLELVAQRKQIDWNLWISLGVPLLRSEQTEQVRPDKSLLLSALPELLETLVRLEKSTREHTALISFVWALRDHFPTAYGRISKKHRQKIEEQLSYGSPRLRRLSLARLEVYL
jgi:transcriptional regulator with XRE-family HTH domain